MKVYISAFKHYAMCGNIYIDKEVHYLSNKKYQEVKKMKYLVEVFRGEDNYSFESNSRNSRKHLLKEDAYLVNVYDVNGELVSRAQHFYDDIILVGARKVVKR